MGLLPRADVITFLSLGFPLRPHSCKQQDRAHGSLWTTVGRLRAQCDLHDPATVFQILENTPQNHVDHSSLKLALERAEELCSQVNEGVREKENSDRLEWIQTHVQCEGLAEVRL